MKKILILLPLSAGVAAAVFWLVPPGGQAATNVASAPVPVVAGPATRGDLPIWLNGVGAVLPIAAVNVHVRVDGQLMRLAFQEGQDVHAGDVLAEIDPRPFEALLRQAQANQAKDEATLRNARTDLGRNTRLAGMGAGTTQQVDALTAQVGALQATIQADAAQVDTAGLNLNFATITAPIDGRVGARQVDAGTIVHAGDATGLVTVTQMQPISVQFSLPQDELPRILAEQAKGPLNVAIETRDGSRHLADGHLSFIDSQVDPQSGQIRLKAIFTNEDRALWPGAFVVARLLLRTEQGVIAVPDRAILRGQRGNYVYVVKPDATVEVRDVRTGPSVGDQTAILAGLQPDEQVVFDGQYRLRAGMRVAATTPTAAATATARAGNQP
ncbi:MAG: efflux transporter periplasmic adaptor subunit [Rubritepida sp.]|nr:efflux transporter periplasmic adaptor subunit [Rubritepida sp.]